MAGFQLSINGRFWVSTEAALQLVEEATLTRRGTDDTWAAVRTCFSDTEIVELVWLSAAENYFNLQAAILRIGSDGLRATNTA